MSSFLSSPKNSTPKSFHVQLTQGLKQNAFEVMAEDPTRAVLTCIESTKWRDGDVDEDAPLRYSVHSADEANMPLGNDLAHEVSEAAVWQYNLALFDEPAEERDTYTVYGTYPGCDDRYATVVYASSETDAVLRAIEVWRSDNDEVVDVELCGLVLGDVTPSDVDYVSDGWSRSDVEENEGRDDDGNGEGSNKDLKPYTVITRHATELVDAVSPFAAECEFNSEEVAAVLVGEVQNLWWDVDMALVKWSLSRHRRSAATVMRCEVINAK